MYKSVDEVMLNMWLRKRNGKCVKTSNSACFMILYYEGSCKEEIIEVVKTCQDSQVGHDLNP